MKIKREILETIVNYSKNITAKDGVRYFLQAVCLDNEKGKLRVYATDAKKLMESVFVSEIAASIEKQCLIYPDSVKMLELLLKKGKQDEFKVKIEESKLSIIDWSNGQSIFLGLTNESDFPNINAIKPKYDKYITIGINPDFLVALKKASGSKKDQGIVLNIPVRIASDDVLANLDAITVDFLGESRGQVGIVMPVRV